MQPQQSQSNMSPEEAKASLGIATHLQQQMLPQGGQPAPQTPSNQTTPEDVKNEITGLETRLMDELSTLRAEMKTQGDGKQELADLKKQIEAILLSND